MAKIIILGKQFSDKGQALLELAFCHYPVSIIVDGEERTFEQFSDVEKFLKDLED